MTIPTLNRFALLTGAAAALLAACDGSETPIGPPAATAQTSATSRVHANRSGSWMLPEAKNEALLYASRPSLNDVSVFSFRTGRRVGQLHGIAQPHGLCTDASGNVYVTSQTSNSSQPNLIYEYAHGATSPTATFTDAPTGAGITGCAVDPATGDLAVTNQHGPPAGAGNVAVFENGSTTPKTYAWNDAEFLFCTYDDSGNLYISGISAQLNPIILELPKGRNALRPFTLSGSMAPYWLSIQWLHNRLLIATSTKGTGVGSIYPIKVSGDTGKIESPVVLQNAFKAYGVEQYWAQGGTIVGPARALREGALRFWSYPQGGMPVKTIISSFKALFDGITVST